MKYCSSPREGCVYVARAQCSYDKECLKQWEDKDSDAALYKLAERLVYFERRSNGSMMSQETVETKIAEWVAWAKRGE